MRGGAGEGEPTTRVTVVFPWKVMLIIQPVGLMHRASLTPLMGGFWWMNWGLRVWPHLQDLAPSPEFIVCRTDTHSCISSLMPDCSLSMRSGHIIWFVTPQTIGIMPHRCHNSQKHLRTPRRSPHSKQVHRCHRLQAARSQFVACVTP